MTAGASSLPSETPATVLFDFDGTLVDSDAALLAPFEVLGIAPGDIPPLGLPLAAACAHVGVHPDEYLAHYDPTSVMPFPGIDALLGSLGRWGLCSNKDRASGQRELTRLGWSPTVALFSDDFRGQPKRLEPLLAALALASPNALYVGDTGHDRRCAQAAGVRFALAGWNTRVTPEPGDLVLRAPSDILALVG